MSSVADSSRNDLDQWMASELANAREEARPISRVTLTRMVTTRFGVNPHEAERLVDRFCDESAPSVPTMLSGEFGVPYLKVLAILNIALSLGFFIMAMKVQSSIFIGLILGLGFLGAAGFCWIRSLKAEDAPPARPRNEIEIPGSIVGGDNRWTRP